ncbi:MAG: SCO family protein [bacterium]
MKKKNCFHHFLNAYAILLLVAVACLWTPAASLLAQEIKASQQIDVLEEVGIDQKLNEQIPLNWFFTDAGGRSVQLQEYFNEKPVILAFVYYECPMLCTMVLNGLLQSINTLNFNVGSHYEIVTVSFDPGETPKLAAGKKTTYVNKYGRRGAADGWHFLTGDEAAIKALTQAAGFKYKYDPETDQYIHASGVMVLTPEGRLSRYFYGVEYSARDLKLALMEASKNKIGSAVDQILLYCYHYDPTTGKYGVAIMRIIRVLGSATVIIIVAFMLIMFRRDRRAKRAAITH